MKHLTVFGGGRLGLPFALTMARHAASVTIYDPDERVIDRIWDNIGPGYGEPGVEDMLCETDNLMATTDIYNALVHSDISFLYVPTRPQQGHRCDSSIVCDVVKSISAAVDAGIVDTVPYPIVVCSTLSPGQMRQVAEHVDCDPDLICLYYAPAFVALGATMAGFENPSHQLLGLPPGQVESDPVVDFYIKVYGRHRLILLDWLQAECAKVLTNDWLSLKPTFVAQCARLCIALGCDPVPVIQALRADPRLGTLFSKLGPVPGGHCLPIDVRAVWQTIADLGYDAGNAFDVLLAPMIERTYQLCDIAAMIPRSARPAIIGMSYKEGLALDLESFGNWLLDFLAQDPVRPPPIIACPYMAPQDFDLDQVFAEADYVVMALPLEDVYCWIERHQANLNVAIIDPHYGMRNLELHVPHTIENGYLWRLGGQE